MRAFLFEQIENVLGENIPDIGSGLLTLLAEFGSQQITAVEAKNLISGNTNHQNALYDIATKYPNPIVGRDIVFHVRLCHNVLMISFLCQDKPIQLKILANNKETSIRESDASLVLASTIIRVLFALCVAISISLVLRNWTDIADSLLAAISIISTVIIYLFPEIKNINRLSTSKGLAFVSSVIMVFYLVIIGIWEFSLGI